MTITDKSKIRILLVFGTRPEAIKMAPLVKEFQKHREYFEIIVCVTAQHREMLDQVLKIFEIVPDYDLNIMKSGQDLYDVTSSVILGMREVLKHAQPDIVLVHGDTSTSTAAALAAFYQQIPVGHVEAGLRTHNIYSPWPEEMNRQITGRLATYHFSPTSLSKQNLVDEGIKEGSIFVTGNTVIDALYWVINILKKNKSLETAIINTLIDFGLPADKLAAWTVQQQRSGIPNEENITTFNSRKLVLITGHRRENFGQGFLNICEAVKELAVNYPDVDFVYPMHLNPNVRKAIDKVFGNAVISNASLDSHATRVNDIKNTYFIEPLDYLPFVYFLNASYLILTDSGGIQEEAPGLGKPVLVMRETTERPEAIDVGTVRLVGTGKEKIISEVSKLLDDPEHYNNMSKAINPYGDGNACIRIVNVLKELFQEL